MPSLNLEYPRDDAKILVKLAFEDTRGIKNYYDAGDGIVGQTGANLVSYGEKIIVEIPENQSAHATMISVRSERRVRMNFFARPDRYESRFLSSLDNMRGQSIDDLLDEYGDVLMRSTKEVTSASQQEDGMWLVYVVVTAMLFFIFLLIILASL